MFRVKNVMVLLVALSLVTAVAVQPAAASVGDQPVSQDGPGNRQGHGTETIITFGDPGAAGEGDPDSVGGGYGARVGDSEIFGTLSDIFSGAKDADDVTFEEIIRMLLEKFVPNP